MAVQAEETGTGWHEIVRATLKANSVPLVVYVPDNVFKPLIKTVHADSYSRPSRRRARKRRSASWWPLADRGAH